MPRLSAALLAFAVAAGAQELARFGEGAGPKVEGDLIRLLDEARTPGQSNAVAFDRTLRGDGFELLCRLRVLEGGDGGAFVFLNTDEYGARGPAPFVKDWTEPNLKGTFAVGIDVHNPPNSEPFGPLGNVMGLPEREVSLHWDGREIVKRLAPAEFRGDFVRCRIAVSFVTGGAEVTVELGFELAVTRYDAPLRFELFNHVLTDNKKTAYEAEVDLPPAEWACGRVLLTLEIHDAGKDWDEWDRNGEISVYDAEGVKRGIVPFITSYRTPCHWVVDVTHFRPLLAGKTRFEIAAGTTFYKNRGYMMSAVLDFYPGAPQSVTHRVDAVWIGTTHYRSGTARRATVPTRTTSRTSSSRAPSRSTRTRRP